ncbi:MAG: hypothetical protein ACTSQY_10730, partial [Candidatus Odinarchaeia archaeon]
SNLASLGTEAEHWSTAFIDNLGNESNPVSNIYASYLKASNIELFSGYTPPNDYSVITKEYADSNYLGIVSGTANTISKFNTAGDDLIDSSITDDQDYVTINNNFKILGSIASNLEPQSQGLTIGYSGVGGKWSAGYFENGYIDYLLLSSGTALNPSLKFSGSNLGFASLSPDRLNLIYNGGTLFYFTIDGDILSDGTGKLGNSDSTKWAEIWCEDLYTGDLHLKNNDGDWTIQEGKSDLFIINNKTGKKFKFMMQEVK